MDNPSLQNALRSLVANENLILPHGYLPGTHNYLTYGPVEPAADEETWNAYSWNPPDYSPYSAEPPDPAASPKPTWQELSDENDAVVLAETREELLFELDETYTRRIGLLYHPAADIFPAKEWHVRLSDEDTTAADASRLVLIAQYNTKKTQVRNATTIAQLEVIEI